MSNDEANFGCDEPFGVDNGELLGIPSHQCFVLGYELADISRQADFVADGFGQPVRAENQERIKRALTKRQRKFSLTYMTNDSSESWMQLWVAPKDE